MTNFRRIVTMGLCIAGLFGGVFASNLQMTNTSIDSTTAGASNQGKANDYVYVKFDISWDNSWRDTENWDAAWVFVKFYDVNECRWRHAWLSSTDAHHTVGTDNGLANSIKVGLTKISDSKGTKGMGVFIYRTEQGYGSNDWDNVRLRWEYADQNVSMTNVKTVKVFGFEMVYVPEGDFYLGDGADYNTHTSSFHYYELWDPYHIVSNSAIIQGAYNSGGVRGLTANYYNCWSSCRTSYGIGGPGGDNGTWSQIYESYPKGYNAVYCMKTLVTQNLYCDFLNTCRNIAPTNNRYPNGYYGEFRFNIDWDGEKFICNASGRGTGTEADDGGWVACNYMEPADMLAFLDWAALRPMTEMEFEKIARGPKNSVVSEYAWGNTNITPSSNMQNKNTANEYYAVGNCHYGQATGTTLATEMANYPIGPCRPGSFAKAGSSREAAGAGYYGTFDMSGNLWDLVIGNLYNRAYPDSSSIRRFSQWVHGDGELATTGSSDTTDVRTWLTLSYFGSSFGKRGGSFFTCTNRSINNTYNNGIMGNWDTSNRWWYKDHSDLFISGRTNAISYDYYWNSDNGTCGYMRGNSTTLFTKRYHKGYINTGVSYPCGQINSSNEYWYYGAFDQGFRGVRTSPEYEVYE